MAEDSSRSKNPLCLTCWHWQGALDLPTGTIGQLYACIRQVPGAGSRFECDQYDPDPMRAKIEFVEYPSRERSVALAPHAIRARTPDSAAPSTIASLAPTATARTSPARVWWRLVRAAAARLRWRP